LVDSGVVNDFGWNGAVISFADGQLGMLDVWLDVASADQSIFMIPGVLAGASEEPVIAYLVFGAAEAVASVVVVTTGDLASTMSTSEIVSAFPGATFTPVYWEYGASPEPVLVGGDPMVVPFEGFSLFTAYLPAGNYYLSTSLTDIWGNEGAELDVLSLTEPLGP
jgi:hypothetical protein